LREHTGEADAGEHEQAAHHPLNNGQDGRESARRKPNSVSSEPGAGHYALAKLLLLR
jgi:hypothetical protein